MPNPGLLAALVMILASTPLVATNADDPPRADVETRSFHFEYSTVVAVIAEDTEQVRFWLPIPRTDENQTITNLRVETQPPLIVRFAREETYQNEYVFIEATGEKIPTRIKVTLTFDVRRHETSTLRTLGLQDRNELLEGDNAASITDEVTRRAQEATSEHCGR